MTWRQSDRFDPRLVELYDRHYSRQTPGAPQVARPARDLCLIVPTEDTNAAAAGWVSLWPRWAMHAWPGAWECQWFRNESSGALSSELIVAAVALTRAAFGEPPNVGMVTFVNVDAVRRKRDPGRCFRRAGFKPVGWTSERGRLVLQLLPADMPAAEQQQLELM